MIDNEPDLMSCNIGGGNGIEAIISRIISNQTIALTSASYLYSNQISLCVYVVFPSYDP